MQTNTEVKEHTFLLLFFVLILPLSTIFLLNFENAPTVLYFIFIIDGVNHIFVHQGESYIVLPGYSVIDLLCPCNK